MDKTVNKKWEFNKASASRMSRTSWHGSQSFIHPRLARQIVNDYKITSGRCLDIGCGAARLTIELAKITDLEVTGLDSSPDMIDVAREKVKEHHMDNQVKLVNASVQEMPFPDNYFDLIVSRGAMGFFTDKVRAFEEIYRVLKPGGRTYIGGGDSRGWPRHPIDFMKKMFFVIDVRRRFISPAWRRLWLSRDQWKDVLQRAGIVEYIIHDGRFWIEIHKNESG